MNYFELDRNHPTIINTKHEAFRVPHSFQEEAFIRMSDMKRKHPEGFSSMLVLPTGAGKTYTAAHWIIPNYIDKGIKVLWVAHRSELLRQAAETFFYDTTEETLPDRVKFTTTVVSSEFGKSVDVTKSKADFVIASRQAIVSGNNIKHYIEWANGKELEANRKLLIVFDEAHHAAARSYRTIIETMQKYIPHIDILGLTATPERTSPKEQGSLKQIFNTDTGIVYSVDMSTLIDLGFLSEPIHESVSTDIDMTKLFSRDAMRKIARNDISTLDEKTLEKLDKNTDRNNLIVNTYLKNKEKYGPTIVFAVDVVNAIALNKLFVSAGVKSDYVVSSVKGGRRGHNVAKYNAETIKAFRDGHLDVLINVNIVTEGTDLPNTKSVFLARPTTSRILMTQMVGRGLRGTLAGGTETTFLVYFIDDWKGMVNFVSPKELLDGEAAETITPTKRFKSKIKQYIDISYIEGYALSKYSESTAPIFNIENLIPYGVINCEYLLTDAKGDESEFSRDILVYDEAKEMFTALLDEIKNKENLFSKDFDFDLYSSELCLKYLEKSKIKYVGISSESIKDIVLSYLNKEELPTIKCFKDRPNLKELAEQIYEEGDSQEELDLKIRNIWEVNKKIRSYFDEDDYTGMMKVYISLLKNVKVPLPEIVEKPKEEWSLYDLKMYANEYYQELINYLEKTAIRDEDGYVYSAIQVRNQPPVRWKAESRRSYEIDHIIPMADGGKSVKENLHLIYWSQNREKGAKPLEQYLDEINGYRIRSLDDLEK